ncbi:hypothetical protein E8E11_011075 [Didymella keratinophila]|nr:hypothetical protein E8E11_011075 [Didymella keratinophila]
MANYARIAVAKQQIAKKIDQRSDNGHYMMAKQVRHEHLPITSHPPSLFAASPPQIYSPTSAPRHPQKPLKASRMPALARNLPPTQQFEAILDASAQNTLDYSWLTPIEQFEKMLTDDLEAKTKAEMQRKAKWYQQ